MEREIRGGEGGTAAERGFVRSTLFNSTTHCVSATISLLKLTVGHKPASIQIDEHIEVISLSSYDESKEPIGSIILSQPD